MTEHPKHCECFTCVPVVYEDGHAMYRDDSRKQCDVCGQWKADTKGVYLPGVGATDVCEECLK